MKIFYTLLGLTALLTFQACTDSGHSVANLEGISKNNMTRCVGCHGTAYELNPLRTSDKVVANMTKAEILTSLTGLSKKDILPESYVFSRMKPHELTASDIAKLAEKIGK